MPEANMNGWQYHLDAHTLAADDRARYGAHVYGAGHAGTHYDGVHKAFSSITYKPDPSVDANPDVRDPMAYQKGFANARDMQPGDTAIVPEDSGSMTPTGVMPGGPDGGSDPNVAEESDPTASPYVTGRRGSQETTIGVGSGNPETMVRETRGGSVLRNDERKGGVSGSFFLEAAATTERRRRQHRLRGGRRQRWVGPVLEPGAVGSGLGEGASATPLQPSIRSKAGDPTNVLSGQKTVGLEKVRPTRTGSTAASWSTEKSLNFPKWARHVGADPVQSSPPKVQRVKGGFRPGFSDAENKPAPDPSAPGQGVGEQVDQYGLPLTN